MSLPRFRSAGSPLAIAFLLVVVAARTFLGRFDRIIADHTIFDGVTYTDAHIILGGLLLICVALIIGAGIAGMNLFLGRALPASSHAPVPAVALFHPRADCRVVRRQLHRQAQPTRPRTALHLAQH